MTVADSLDNLLGMIIRNLIASLALIALPNLLFPAEKNVIFFITDDESPTLGCYGDKVARTPAIDALAADGTLFLNAFATTASCSASRSVVMSGLHNHANGQYGHQHAFHKFASYYNVIGLSLPRAMSNAGYRTGHIGKYHVSRKKSSTTKLTSAETHATPSKWPNSRVNSSLRKRKALLFVFRDLRPASRRRKGQDFHSDLKPDLFGNKLQPQIP